MSHTPSQPAAARSRPRLGISLPGSTPSFAYRSSSDSSNEGKKVNPVIGNIARFLRGRDPVITSSDPDIYKSKSGERAPRELQPTMLVKKVSDSGRDKQIFPTEYLASIGVMDDYLERNIIQLIFHPIVNMSGAVQEDGFMLVHPSPNSEGLVHVRYPNSKWKEVARNFAVIPYNLQAKEDDVDLPKPHSAKASSMLYEALRTARQDDFGNPRGFNHRDYEDGSQSSEELAAVGDSETAVTPLLAEEDDEEAVTSSPKAFQDLEIAVLERLHKRLEEQLHAKRAASAAGNSAVSTSSSSVSTGASTPYCMFQMQDNQWAKVSRNSSLSSRSSDTSSSCSEGSYTAPASMVASGQNSPRGKTKARLAGMQVESVRDIPSVAKQSRGWREKMPPFHLSRSEGSWRSPKLHPQLVSGSPPKF